MEFGQFQKNADDPKIMGTYMKDTDTDEYICFRNIPQEEHMFMANNIYSSYYWLRRGLKQVGLVIDVALGDGTVDVLNEELSFQ